jgi:hypothetical protein
VFDLTDGQEELEGMVHGPPRQALRFAPAAFSYRNLGKSLDSCGPPVLPLLCLVTLTLGAMH